MKSLFVGGNLCYSNWELAVFIVWLYFRRESRSCTNRKVGGSISGCPGLHACPWARYWSPNCAPIHRSVNVCNRKHLVRRKCLYEWVIKQFMRISPFTMNLIKLWSIFWKCELNSCSQVYFTSTPTWCCTSFDPVEHVPTKNRTRLVLSKVELLMHYSQYRAVIFKNFLFALKNITAPRSSTQPLRMTSLARHKYTTSFRGLPMFAWATYAWFRLLFKPYITWHAPHIIKW